MTTQAFIALVVLLIPVVSIAEDAGPKPTPLGKPPMPVFITPFYESAGPKITLGEHGKKLAAADAKSILPLIADLKKEQDKLRPEVMYVTAIRLYDLGEKDHAVYWFYTAQYRARLFTAVLDPSKVGTIGSEAFELKKAYAAFNQLVGEYINGYAFGDPAKLGTTLTTVNEEGAKLPKFKELFPAVAFAPEATWDEKNRENSKGLAGMINYIKTNADSIKEQRKKNGIEGKY